MGFDHVHARQWGAGMPDTSNRTYEYAGTFKSIVIAFP